MPMELEHLVPLASGAKTTENNLWLSCRRCKFKGARTTTIDPLTGEAFDLFNPRQQVWSEHFRWNEDGTEIVGVTPMGRATAAALRLNHSTIVAARKLWPSLDGGHHWNKSSMIWKFVRARGFTEGDGIILLILLREGGPRR